MFTKHISVPVHEMNENLLSVVLDEVTKYILSA